MDISESQQSIIDEFSALPDQDDRYRRIIEYGSKLLPMSAELKMEKYRIKECASVIWLHAKLERDRVRFVADGVPEAKISKGLVALLLEIYDNRTPEEVLSASADFINRLGVGARLLSMGRANGLSSMVRQMKMYAAVFQAMLKAGR